MRYLMIALMLTISGCSASMTAAPTPKGDLLQYQVHDITSIQRFAYTPSVLRDINRSPGILKPSDNDFYTLETDLNNDGRPDVLGVIDHYLFRENGTIPLYILIKNDYDYTQLAVLRITSRDVSVQSTVTNGFKDISADGKVYKYDGKNYK